MMGFKTLTCLELEAIHPHYKSAMESRRVGCALEIDSFINHFSNGFEYGTLIAFGNEVDGYILGDITYNIFKPSHFAPKTKRGGYNLFKALKNEDVILFVTNDLASMLSKIGYYTFSNWTVPMWFRGEIVTKYIYTSCGELVSLISKILSMNIDFNNIDIESIKETIKESVSVDVEPIDVQDSIYRKFAYYF